MSGGVDIATDGYEEETEQDSYKKISRSPNVVMLGAPLSLFRCVRM